MIDNTASRCILEGVADLTALQTLIALRMAPVLDELFGWSKSAVGCSVLFQTETQTTADP
jgi:hypothetical protein